jgi:carboxypeptidase C (cathepsin A)
VSNRGAVAEMGAPVRVLAIYFVFLLAFCFTASHPVVNLSPAEYTSQQQAILEEVDIFPPEWNISGGASSDQSDGRGEDLSKPVFQAAIVNPGDSAAAGNLEMTDNSVQQAGYFDTDDSSGSRIFFWMFPSQHEPSLDPVIIWLQGGPGASGLYGILNQWGPKRIKRKTPKPPAGQPAWDFDDNPYRLDQKATVIFIDQPVGTGFSYSEHNPPRVVNNSKAAVNDLIWWLGKFRRATFQTKDGPLNFANNPLHIAGPSYSGHIIPLLAQQIMVQNAYPALKSILIGNGMTDLALQVPHAYDVACEADTYDPPRPGYKASNCDVLKENLIKCQKKLATCNPGGACPGAWDSCSRTYTAYKRDEGDIDDFYDLDTTTVANRPPNLRKSELVDAYVNARRNQFGITARDRNGMGHDFQITNGNVITRFDVVGDHSVSYRRSLSYLLDNTNVKVMLYAVSFFSAKSSAASPFPPRLLTLETSILTIHPGRYRPGCFLDWR